jgi:hypothetical protein
MVTILYHDDADGYGAAFAFWCKYGDAATYIPVQYKQPFPEIPKGTQFLYIVDFSYDRNTLVSLLEEYNVTVLDHHKVAEKELAGLPFAHFDMSKSGAILAWEYLFPDKAAPYILEYVQDRDLWRFKLPRSKEVNAYIASMEKSFQAWFHFDLAKANEIGGCLLSYQKRQVERSVKEARVAEFFGYTVPLVNCTTNISEVGHELIRMNPDAPFVVMYFDTADGRRVYSLRSKKFDVGAFAKEHGGGGHVKAAGFNVKITAF